jgi:Ca-activated chloride channel homolog
MYMPEHFPVHGLSAASGEKVALQSVNVEVTFKNLLCETTTGQVYKNLENKPIEAVYTFPLTSKAVLLGLQVTIGGKELQGVVVKKAPSDERFLICS